MYRPTQLKIFRFPNDSTAYGGSLQPGKRKAARPVSVKEAMHVVLRSESARGKYSLLLPKNARLIHSLLKHYGKKFEVRTYSFAFVGNHVHLLLRTKSKQGFQNFLRIVSGQAAQRITGARPGQPLTKQFWDLLAYSRIVPWGRAYETAKKYVLRNVLEAATIQRFSPLANSS